MASGIYFDGSKDAVAGGREIIVYVEGADDAYFVDALLENIGASPLRVGIIYSGGVAEMQADLRLLALSGPYRRGDIKRIALIRDADTNSAAALAALHAAMSQNGMPNPAHGAVVQDGDRSFGVYVIPNGLPQGNLESLLLEANAADDRLTRVGVCFDEVEAAHGRLDRREKRVAQMYMAVRPEDCRGVGRAYKLGVFNLSPRIEHLRDFLVAFTA